MIGPELFFGLVSPTGTESSPVCEALEAALEQVGYKAERVSISSLIDSVTGGRASTLPEDERMRRLMDEGTRLRQDSERADLAALLAVGAIRHIREEQNQLKNQMGEDDGKRPSDIPLPKTAYILRSLKRPEEVRALRNIYGRAFSVISIYSSESEHLESLARRIAESRYSSDAAKFRHVAQQLITIDREEEKDSGQRVRHTFPLLISL
jgi:hypothetical protein